MTSSPSFTASKFFASMLLCLGLCGGLLGGCTDSAPTMGVVDVVLVIQDSAPGRHALEHVNKVREILQSNLNAVQQKVASYPDKKQAQEIVLATQAQLQQLLQAHESAVNTQLSEMLQRAVRQHSETSKLSMIFGKDTLMDFNPALDITPALLIAFDKLALSLPPLPAVVADPALPEPRPVAAPEKAKKQDVKAAPERRTEPKPVPEKRDSKRGERKPR